MYNHALRENRPEGYVPEGLEVETYGQAFQWEEELGLHKMYGHLKKLDAPRFIGKYLQIGEDKKVKPTEGSMEEWVNAMDRLRTITKQLHIKLAAAEFLLAQVREYSRSLQSCCPLPYDQEMFELGWEYQEKWILHRHHGSVSRIPDSIEEKAKEAYEKCRNLFDSLTDGLRTHNFFIVTRDDRTTASFRFTVESVPGEMEIYFPLIVPCTGNQEATIEYAEKPMAMSLGWHLYDIIPVLDKFLCRTYSLDDIKKGIWSYVKNEEWRNNLHKNTIKRDKDGNEKDVVDGVPDWYEAEIQKCIAKSAVEKPLPKESEEDE